MAFSLALSAYLAVSDRLVPFAERKLAARLKSGKEDPARIDERRGVASIERPPGELIWFHAASVGESLSLLDLIEQVIEERPDVNILITTGTRSSAELIATRLPDQTIHQFVPVDARPYVKRFLEHWSPDLAIWTESELWPALVSETRWREIPMVLINARMSAKSYKRWWMLKGMSRAVLNAFTRILVQDETSAKYLRGLGAEHDRVIINGSLKESTGALPYEPEERDLVAGFLETRPVWLAASTHPGEEEIVAAAHKIVRRAAPRLLLIIAPRHAERGPEIAKVLRENGWKVGLRSDGDEPKTQYEIYVADTMGEMGLWYRIAPISFLGGSLVKIGGHNPFEPAALGSAILYGPHVENAREAYVRFSDGGAAIQVASGEELGKSVMELLSPHRAAELAHAAWEISSAGEEPAQRVLTLICELLDT